MTPHVHADLIKAWADGAEIETVFNERWETIKCPNWYSDCKYRIKDPYRELKEAAKDPTKQIRFRDMEWIDCGEYTANEFNRVHDGLGMIVHRRSPAPNPFFVEDWSERFDGDALPENATSILIEDGDYEAWRASQLLAEYC